MTIRGSSFGYESSHVHKGRELAYEIFVKGSVYILRDVVKLLCIFFLFLLHLPHIYCSCDHLTYIVLIFR